MLPDSNVNEPLSNGFFRYGIAQQTGNDTGTVINNQAAIYFDLNPLIFTNTTFHMVGEDFVPKGYLSINTFEDAAVVVRAYPNPFTDWITITVEGKTFDHLEVVVYDLLGHRVAYRESYNSAQVRLPSANLPKGFYVYELLGDQERISSGKIRVE